MDRVDAWLKENITIPAQCLWRSDLDRRLENQDGTLKLQYPSILTGAEAATLLENIIRGPKRESLNRALRAFVSEQFENDTEVKFRQVDLANTLLSLFVDVPVNVTPLIWPSTRQGQSPQHAQLASHLRRIAYHPEDDSHMGDGSFSPFVHLVNAANLLLDSTFQKVTPWVLLHGAPGQGKSTLAQYVCQVHRARYLNKADYLDSLPDEHRATSFRLPIKVDLRDLSDFLEGKPYRGKNPPVGEASRTLETFLATLISVQSGGLQFETDDLVQSLQAMPVLLFLDGLDEVADLEVRSKLVSTTTRALSRLSDNNVDIQVVVTSRPNLFAKSAQFGKEFTRVSLAPLGRDTIKSYAEKWTVARNLNEKRTQEVLRILVQKLNLAHIRELTKNPMQLTILLSLIHSIGHSLPDVRTELYREYVSLFMAREAEKSDVVLQYRNLLSDIVEYLAWTLQASAEADGASGSLSEQLLRDLVGQYLADTENDARIVDDLFKSGIERVWVLVQRVEGLYEFEVQPLREYFAAKYLYSTAPHSSQRKRVVHGDRPQRFEAMAANPYWANVTRFYAGFYHSGELGGLYVSLKELISSKDPAIGITARSMGAALLSDWVFVSKKSIQRDVIDLVYDNVGIPLLIGGTGRSPDGSYFDPECGQEHLAHIIFDYLKRCTPSTQIMIASSLYRTGGSSLRDEFITWTTEAEGEERRHRFTVALIAGGVSEQRDIEKIVDGDVPTPLEASLRLYAALCFHQEIFAQSQELSVRALRSLLLSGVSSHVPPLTLVGKFASLLGGRLYNPHLSSYADAESPEKFTIDDPQLDSLREILSHTGLPSGGDEENSAKLVDEVDLVEEIRANFGDSWLLYQFTAIGVADYAFRPLKSLDNSASDLPLFRRGLLARNWRGRSSWWADLLTSSNGKERTFWLLMLLAWAPAQHLRDNALHLDKHLTELSADDYHRLTEALAVIRSIREYRGDRKRGAVKVSVINRRLNEGLYFAVGDAQIKYLIENSDLDARIQRDFQENRLVKRLEDFPGWSHIKAGKMLTSWLDTFTEVGDGRAVMLFEARAIHRQTESRMMSETIAARITSLDPAGLSNYVVATAHQALLAKYRPTAVRRRAENEEWTFE